VILVLFDLDGTLLHAHGSGRDAFDAVILAQHGIAEACAGIRFGGKTDPQILDEVLVARRGRPATRVERDAFLDAYLPRLRAQLERGGVEVIDGADDALRFLAARSDVRLGVATGNVRAGAELKLAIAGLTPWFAGAIGGYGCDSHVRAELVAAAIARGRAAGEVDEVIVIGDTIHDIAAARACGAIACAVATGSDPAAALAHADVVLSSLRELPAWFGGRLTAAAAPTTRSAR
jgi:phosphoglycolate phosphatase-like HAD superfamily hydrolase